MYISANNSVRHYNHIPPNLFRLEVHFQMSPKYIFHIEVPEYFELGFSYNLEMCEGIIYHL